MSVNGASMIVGLACRVITIQFGRKYTYPTYWEPLYAKQKLTQHCPSQGITFNGASPIFGLVRKVITNQSGR